jgi:hypothetical protein
MAAGLGEALDEVEGEVVCAQPSIVRVPAFSGR